MLSGRAAQQQKMTTVEAEAGSNNNSNRTEGSMTLGTQSSPERITLSDIHEDLTTLTSEMRQLATETCAASERAEARMLAASERADARMLALTEIIVAQGSRKVQCIIM